jgi:hypothetical protein
MDKRTAPAGHFQLPCLNRSDDRRLSYGPTNEIVSKRSPQLAASFVSTADSPMRRHLSAATWTLPYSSIAVGVLPNPKVFGRSRLARHDEPRLGGVAIIRRGYEALPDVYFPLPRVGGWGSMTNLDANYAPPHVKAGAQRAISSPIKARIRAVIQS